MTHPAVYAITLGNISKFVKKNEEKNFEEYYVLG